MHWEFGSDQVCFFFSRRYLILIFFCCFIYRFYTYIHGVILNDLITVSVRSSYWSVLRACRVGFICLHRCSSGVAMKIRRGCYFSYLLGVWFFIYFILTGVIFICPTWRYTYILVLVLCIVMSWVPGISAVWLCCWKWLFHGVCNYNHSTGYIYILDNVVFELLHLLLWIC